MASTASFPRSKRDWLGRLTGGRSATLLVAGAAIFAAPVLAAVAHDAWIFGNGAHMLFILGGGCWLLFDALRAQPLAPGRLAVSVALLVPVALLYLLGRISGIAWIAWIAVCAAGVVLVRDRFGWRGVARAAVPLALLVCMAPPPIGIVVPVSDGIIAATAQVAVALLRLVEIDAAIATPMLYINQYELQLAEACAGLNTVFTLTICMVLYAYLRHRLRWQHALILAAIAMPVALLANLLRILLIAGVIVTFGEASAQGVVHDLTGVTVFAIALTALIAIDELACRVWQ